MRVGENDVTARFPGHHPRVHEQTRRTAVKEVQLRQVSNHALTTNRGSHEGRESGRSADEVELSPKRNGNLMAAAASIRVAIRYAFPASRAARLGLDLTAKSVLRSFGCYWQDGDPDGPRPCPDEHPIVSPDTRA